MSIRSIKKNDFFVLLEQQAKLENWPPTNDDDDEDLKQREEQSESKLFLSVDEKMKTGEEKEGMEQPGADHASSVHDLIINCMKWCMMKYVSP